MLCLPAHIMYKGIRQLRLSVLTWVAPFRQQSHFSSCHQALSGSTDYVELFSMNVNLKMFCILSLCIILCDTSKASENLSFVLKHLTLILLSVFVVIVCFLEVGAIKIQDSVEQMTLDFLFQNCDVPEEASVTLIVIMRQKI